MIEHTLRLATLNPEFDSDADWPATVEDLMPIARSEWDDDTWVCACGGENEGEFECIECGQPLEIEDPNWF